MIDKFASEQTFRTMQFRRSDGGGPLNDEETLTAATVVVVDAEGAEQAAMVSDVSVYDSTQARYLLKAGVAGDSYQVVIRATTSNGQAFEERLALRVK